MPQRRPSPRFARHTLDRGERRRTGWIARRLCGPGQARPLDRPASEQHLGARTQSSSRAGAEHGTFRSSGSATPSSRSSGRANPHHLGWVVKEVTSASFEALGTTAALFISDPDFLARSRQLLERELAAIDRSCSRFRADSELNRVNVAEGRPVRVGELFIEALEVSLRAAQLTNGLVDPTVGRAICAIGYDRDFRWISANPSIPACGTVVPGWQTIQVSRSNGSVRVPPSVQLDLGATAKALAADRAAREIEAAFGIAVLVNLGGDIAVAGEAPAGGWRIRISDDHRDQTAPHGETVSISAGGLATSSTAVRRWSAGGKLVHHIVDPRRGSSAEIVWRTASVAAGSCVDANTASTAAIVSGREAPAWLDRLGLPSRLVCHDGCVLRLSGWPRCCE